MDVEHTGCGNLLSRSSSCPSAPWLGLTNLLNLFFFFFLLFLTFLNIVRRVSIMPSLGPPRGLFYSPAASISAHPEQEMR
jgi:hypothetical protein